MIGHSLNILTFPLTLSKVPRPSYMTTLQKERKFAITDRYCIIVTMQDRASLEFICVYILIASTPCPCVALYYSPYVYFKNLPNMIIVLRKPVALGIINTHVLFVNFYPSYLINEVGLPSCD